MLYQMVLSVSQSKRLIAKGIAKWPPVIEKLKKGMIVITKGTTNRYVAEELLGETLDQSPFAWGIVAPTGTKMRDDIDEIVIKDGRREHIGFEDAVESMSPGDIFIKGGNALNYENKTVGVLSTSPVGGTIGKAYPKVLGSRIRLLIPIGLEKCVSTPIEKICSVLGSPEIGKSSLPTMYAIKGDIFTEIEALRTLCGIEAHHIASGGVAGHQGSVRLVVEGSTESIDRVIELGESLRSERAYEP